MVKNKNEIKLNKCRIIILQIFILLILPLQILSAKWEPSNSPTGGYVRNLISHQGDIFANAFNSGIYQSTTNNAIWSKVNPPNHHLGYTRFLFNDGNVIYAATDYGGIFKSSNKGADWVRIHNGMTQENFPIRVNIIKKIESEIYFCSTEGAFFTTDEGNSWQVFKNFDDNKNVLDIEKQDENYYLLYDIGCYRTPDKGTVWVKFNYDFDLPNIQCYKILKIDSNLLFCVRDTTGLSGFLYRIYEKNPESDKPNPYYPDEFNDYEVLGFSTNQSNLSLSVGSRIDNTVNYKIFHSIDRGNAWQDIYDTTFFHSYFLTNALTNEGNYIYAGTLNDGVLRINTTNNNSEIITRNIHNFQMTTLAFKGNDSYIGTSNFVASDITTSSNGIYYSGNAGASWTQLKSSPKANPEQFYHIFKIAFLGENILAGTNNGMYSSSDKGNTWKSLGLNDNYILDITIENNVIYAAGNLFSGNLYISSDAGETWATRPIPDKAGLLGFLKDGNNIFVTTQNSIYQTSNLGLNWNKVSDSLPPPLNSFLPIVRSGNNLLAASSEGIYISENNGFEWKKSVNILSNSQIISLSSFGQYLFCSTPWQVYMSLNNGTDWYEISEGLGNHPVSGFGIRLNEVYAILSRDAIHKTSLFDLSKIRINNLQGDIYCNDMEFEINYSVEDEIDFTKDNFFIAELSDANGRFSDESTVIGTVQSATSGVIQAKIPSGTAFGTGYRIRIKSTSPAYIGVDNLFNIIILEKSEPVISGVNNACEGETITYSTQIKPGFTYKWLITDGEIIGPDNSGSVNVRWTSIGSSSIKVIQQSIASCSDSSSVTVLISPSPAKPVINATELTLISSADTGNQWYFNGAEMPGETNSYITPASDGIYTVIVKNEFGCLSEMSEPFLFEHFEDKLVFEFDDSQAIDGDDVFVNIRLVKNKKYYQLGVQSIKATLVFNASLLYPLSEDKGVIIDGKRYIQIDIDTNYISQNIVKVLRFTAMLGNSETTDLILENVLINGQQEESVRVIAGTFKLLDICYDGGARLITSIPPPSIESISPNPANDQIRFSIKNYENTISKLYLMNTLGMIEKVLYSGNLSEGTHEFSYPLGGISIGDHYLILETSNSRIMRNFIISR